MNMGEQGRTKRIRRGGEEEIPKVDIYFLIMGSDKERWYAIKSSDYSDNAYGEIRKKRLEPALPDMTNHIRDCSFAAVGSKIFASGSLDDSTYYKEKKKKRKYKDIRFVRFLISSCKPAPSNKVFYIDILHLEEGWRDAPPMNTVRSQHYMAADDGKMYVFGGLRCPSNPNAEVYDRIFGEVYDPSNPNAGWKMLALAHIRDGEFELPQTIHGHAFVEDGHSDNRNILFHSYFHKSLYYLSTTHHETGKYDENFGEYHASSVFLDGVLFSLSYSRIYAYDISTCSGKDQSVVLRGVRPDTLPHRGVSDKSRPKDILQSLGNGHLALVWAREPEFIEFVDVHCTIIKISKEGDLFVGDVLSYSSYSVKGFLRSCMVVPSLEENVCLDEERDKNNKRSDKQHQRKRERDEFNNDTKERIREEKRIQERRRTGEERRREHQRYIGRREYRVSQGCWRCQERRRTGSRGYDQRRGVDHL